MTLLLNQPLSSIWLHSISDDLMYVNKYLNQLLLHMYLMNVMTFMEVVRIFQCNIFYSNWNCAKTGTLTKTINFDEISRIFLNSRIGFLEDE